MIPWEFEYELDGHKTYVTVLQKFKQHYTGEYIYRIRCEHDDGDIDELLRTERQMKKLLTFRVEVEE